MTRYDYEMLRSAAIAYEATQDDINALGEWFTQFGKTYWNGEYYDADGLRLFPVYKASGETEDCFEIAGYEFR